MRNRKATGDYDIPGDVLKLLGYGGLKILAKVSNTIYNTGEWPLEQIRNAWKDMKYGAGDGWRRSVGPIM